MKNDQNFIFLKTPIKRWTKKYIISSDTFFLKIKEAKIE